jgi:hypothetical protein
MIDTNSSMTRAALLLVGLLLSSANALASTTFSLAFSGAEFLNSAEAYGTITFEPAPPNPTGEFGTLLFPDFEVSAFSLTVSGASSGNGTFELDDFSFFTWNTKGVELDLSQDLIGQITVEGKLWASEEGAGGFGLEAASGSGAPQSLAWYVLQTNELAGDYLRLTSFTPVPVPAAIWLFGSALSGLLGGAFRRSRRQSA